jgi:hypothetical protein
MCMANLGDSPEFNVEKIRKAVKKHVCSECSREILRGEKYMYASGKYEGMLYTSKMCLHCTIGANWLLDRCHGYMYGAIANDIEEHLFDNVLDDPEEKIWVENIHEGMCKKWKTESGELMPVPKNFVEA